MRSRPPVAAGALIVGLDLIGGRLTEINVTSPTCMVEIAAQTGFSAAEPLHAPPAAGGESAAAAGSMKASCSSASASTPATAPDCPLELPAHRDEAPRL
ncbi:hypothetical protein [Hydrogenophilus thermoluteolus]|uniref:hypothetical protein n=1 Tax=Hydrogenophilus thermoluteolus TaxID=297 RepID=UPI003F6760B6